MVESISIFAATEYADMKPTKKQMKQAILPVLTVLCASFVARADDDVTLRMVFDTDRDVSINNATTYRYIATSGNHGGALEVAGNASYVTNADVTFLGNSVSGEGYHGGALYNHAFKGVTFKNNVSFNGNSALAGNGGAVYNVNGILNLYTTYTDGRETFVDNYARDSGGAIYNSVNGRVNVWGDVKFKGNKSTGSSDKASGGGAYYGGSHSILSFEDGKTVFESNVASSGNGGAIYAANGSYVKAAENARVTFTSNEAENGGAVYADQGSSFTSSSDFLIFESNKANAYGGAIYNAGNFSLGSAVLAAEFKGNSATGASSSGGAVYNKGTFKTERAVEFSDNTAKSSGGALYNDNNGTFNFGASFIAVNNSAESGGAVMNRGTLERTSYNLALFQKNRANSAGGAIYNASKISLYDASFENNTAGTVGGAVRNGGSFLACGNISFTSNEARTGGAVFNSSDDSASFSLNGDANFQGNKSTGRGDDVGGGAIYNLKDVNFFAWSGNGTVKFNGNEAVEKGGALYNAATGATATIYAKTISFTDNKATGTNGAGGAVYNIGKAAFGRADTASLTFKGNTAKTSGGAIYNTGSFYLYGIDISFSDNTAENGGGAIYNEKETVLAGDATFINNSTVENAGGAIYNKSVFKLTGNGVFRDNRASEYCDPADACTGGRGGAIYNEAGAEVTLAVNGPNKKFQFESNIAGFEGGALYNGGKTTITGKSEFTQNKTLSGNGGAVYNKGELTLSDADFTSNEAEGDGGALYNEKDGIINAGFLTVKSNKAANTYEDAQGGAIFNEGSITLAGGAFEGNTSQMGGGAVYNKSGASIETGSVSFTNNQVVVDPTGVMGSGEGGAIFNEGVVTITGHAEFINNAAIGGSAGAVLNRSAFTLTGSGVFDSNRARQYCDTDGDCSEGDGGVLMNMGKAEMTASGANGSFQFKGNSADRNGGAIYNSDTVTISGKTDFTGNTAGSKGGAIYNKGGTFTMTGDATFYGNNLTKDDSYGGAIYNGGAFTLTGNATFGGNKAKEGGAVWVYKDFSVTGNAKFTSNTASTSGGAIYLDNNSVTLGSADFIGNTAQTENGGAIYAAGSTLFTVTGASMFNGNAASLGDGGALFVEDGSAVFSGFASFTNNSAGSADGRNGGLGGAIYNNGGDISFSAGATFEGNKAGDSGGAIYNLANSTVRFSGGTYTFKNNSDSSGLNDIYNDGTLNIGAANKTTIFNVSHVTGGGLAQIEGNTTLNAAQAGGTINWRNVMSVDSSGSVLTIADNIKFNGVNNDSVGRQDGGALFNSRELVANGNGEFIGNKAHQHGGAMATLGGTTVWNGHLTFERNEATADGGALHTRFSGTTTLTGGADFIGNVSGGYGGGIYNGSVTNLFGGTYTFKNNSDSSGLNDIFNGSNLNVGIAGKTTSLVISFVTGGGTTTFDGDVTVSSIKDNGVQDNTNTVSWENKIALAGGATLNIGKSVLNVGANNFDASGGTLKLSISDMTADSSDYVGGQFKTGGTATIGKLFVTVDPSLIFSGTTGELLLLDGYTGTFTADQIGISDGYTITYTEDGKFIIGCANGTCGGLRPPPPANPENAGFSVIEVSRANVRSVLGALTSRASSGFTAGGFKGRSAGAETQKYGLWVQGMYNNLHHKDVSADSMGVVTGFDAETSENTVLGVGYSYASSSADATGSSTDIDMHNVFVYARYNPSAFFVDASAGYGFGTAKIENGPQYDMRYAHASADAGVNFYTKSGTLTPIASVRYTFTTQDGYVVEGVQYEAGDSNLLTGVAGLRWSRDYTADGKSFKPYVSAAATYDFISDEVKTTQISGGAVLVENGGRTKRLGAEFTAGVRAVLSNHWTLMLDYKGNFTSDYRSNTGLISAEFKF